VQHRDVDRRFYRGLLRPEHVRRPLQQPCPLLVDEVRMHVILLRQLG
jgi:hypothetical protein